MRQITRRETLLECLDIMKKFRNNFSQRGYGMAPIERYTALYDEYDKKCEILREMIQALESEPVRRVLSEWQKEVMENGPEALRLDGGSEPAADFREGFGEIPYKEAGDEIRSD